MRRVWLKLDNDDTATQRFSMLERATVTSDEHGNIFVHDETGTLVWVVSHEHFVLLAIEAVDAD